MNICDIVNCPDNIYRPVVMTHAFGLPDSTKHGKVSNQKKYSYSCARKIYIVNGQDLPAFISNKTI